MLASEPPTYSQANRELNSTDRGRDPGSIIMALPGPPIQSDGYDAFSNAFRFAGH